jgi:CPA2 family monovalent cation:H+ antiporter-2
MHHVIIAGYGPVGRTLADELAERNIPITILDTNPQTVRTQQSLGRAAVRGDATDPDALHAAGIRRAGALAITIPDAATAIDACAVARSLAPDLYIIVRTSHLSQATRAIQNGADSVTVEEIAAAEALARTVRERMLLPRVEQVCEGAD